MTRYSVLYRGRVIGALGISEPLGSAYVDAPTWKEAILAWLQSPDRDRWYTTHEHIHVYAVRSLDNANDVYFVE